VRRRVCQLKGKLNETGKVQALLASISVMKAGCGRFRIDVDTTVPPSRSCALSPLA